MIKKLCEYNRRSEFIIKILKDIVDLEDTTQQIMVIGHNKSLLKYLHDSIEHHKIAPVGYYVGGMKEKDLKESEGMKIIIATYAMAEEALDIKTLSTLVMATPKVDVRQAVGRILRNQDGEKVVIDIIDQHNIFLRHWNKRRIWYNKQKFKIIMTDNHNYDKNKWESVGKNKKIKTQSLDPLASLMQGKCLF